MSRHPELLIPASSLEVLKIAVIFGADAVYIGGEVFGLRAKAKNFSHDDMKEGIAFAHECPRCWRRRPATRSARSGCTAAWSPRQFFVLNFL